MAGEKIGQRDVIAAGVLVCRDTEAVTIPAGAMTLRVTFQTQPNQPPSINFNANGNNLAVVIVNVDAQPGGPIEVPSSFVEKIGQSPAGKDLILALYVHSRGQAKVRQVAYTLSA
jgi:hypothetical protein